MKKYIVELSELIHYDSFEILAKDLDEAREIATTKVNDGDVPIKNIETAHWSVKGLGEAEETNEE